MHDVMQGYAGERHRSHKVILWFVPDRISIEKRSKAMSSIRSKNTKPEKTIRKLLWERGKRYRVHDKSIFGKPDLTNKAKKNSSIHRWLLLAWMC